MSNKKLFSPEDFDKDKTLFRPEDFDKEPREPKPSPDSTTAAPTAAGTSEPTGDGLPPKKSKGWIWWVAAAVVVVAGGVWYFAARDNGDASQQEQTAVVAAAEPASDSSAEEAAMQESGEVAPGTTPQTADADAGQPAAAEPAVPATAPENDKPAAKAAPTGDIEDTAMSVIRGNYGNGNVRKQNLGDKYQTIQNRVNQLKREGAF